MSHERTNGRFQSYRPPSDRNGGFQSYRPPAARRRQADSSHHGNHHNENHHRHHNNHQKNHHRRETPASPSVCFFGDSFVRKFGLVKHPSLEVHAFKGATAKGLTRVDNDNRRRIVEFLRRRPNAERIVFGFGNVDVHLSYYYRRYGGDDGDDGDDSGEQRTTIDLERIASDYVDFVASTIASSSSSSSSRLREVVVLGVYPSAPRDEFLPGSLVSYGSLTEEQAARIPPEDASTAARTARVRAFNDALRRRCAARNDDRATTYPFYSCEDVVDEMTDPDDGGRLREAYRDVSDHNIHVVWETTVSIWTRRWPWLARLAPADFAENMQRTLADYVRTKPWAERKQIAQAIGVRAAVDKENRKEEEHEEEKTVDQREGRGRRW